MLKPTFRPGDRVLFARAHEHERAEPSVFVVEEVLNFLPKRVRIHPPGRPGDFRLVDVESLRFAGMADVPAITIAARAGGVMNDWCWWLADEARLSDGVVGPFQSPRQALEDIVLWEQEHRRHAHVSELVEHPADLEHALPIDNIRRRVSPSNRHLSSRLTSARRFFTLRYQERNVLDGTLGDVRDLRIALIGDDPFHGFKHTLVVELREVDAAGEPSWRIVPENGAAYRAAAYALVRWLLDRAVASAGAFVGTVVEGERIGEFTFEPAPVQ